MKTDPSLVGRMLSVVREPAVMGSLAVFTGVLFVLSIVAVPWFVARMPEDYFSKRDGGPATASEKHGLGLAWAILKNVLGALLLFAGVLMLFLPGQGILTMFVGLALLDFPGKHRLERRFVSAPPVLKALNALRRRADRPPLVIERSPRSREPGLP